MVVITGPNKEVNLAAERPDVCRELRQHRGWQYPSIEKVKASRKIAIQT